MADRFDTFRDAYDKTTGKKLPHQVPESHFEIFKNLRKTPAQKAQERAATSGQATQATTEKEK